MKTKKHFFVMYKNFNNGEIEKHDVFPSLYNRIFTSAGKLSKKSFYTFDDNFNKMPITSKEQLKNFIISHFAYHYRCKCEWEFIVCDWPPRDNPREKKIDAFQQLMLNIDLITDLVWEDVEKKLKK